ncbi:MAG: rhodanese-like domain-containing protein [Oligoflexales bacterium]
MITNIFYSTLFFLIFLNSTISGAMDFCSNINKYAKNKDETTKYIDDIKKFAQPILSDKDCSTIKKYEETNWALIDSRDKASRKSTGSFKGTVKILSDHHDASNHKFDEANLKKKLGKYFGNTSMSLDEIKGKNLILFCNGLKCFRSSWAACSLKELGFKKDNIFVVLDGYTGIKNNCIK